MNAMHHGAVMEGSWGSESTMVDDADAAAIGWTGHDHRVFLSDFYAGESPGSFARGAVFQHNPETGDRRISGTAASLAGVEAALAHAAPHELDLALADFCQVLICLNEFLYVD